MEKFVVGIALGAIGGALLTANNYKMRRFVRKSQEEVQAKLDKFIDEKTEEIEEKAEDLKEKAEETLEKRKMKKKEQKAEAK
ncbi:MAG: hypothetical protein IJY05_03700 [Clostridia bacterium]|nr:hypothetical protein [Clostridia bacterium]